MALIDEIQKLQRVAERLEGQQINEEETKRQLIAPFLSALGWDVQNEKEVRREHQLETEYGRGFADYAILYRKKPIIVVECKAGRLSLTGRHQHQLWDYFRGTKPVVGLLTNGFQYLFYTDSQSRGQMDGHYYFGLDLLDDIEHSDLEQLELLTKVNFQIRRVRRHVRQQAKSAIDQEVQNDIWRVFRLQHGGLHALSQYIAGVQDEKQQKQEINLAVRKFRSFLEEFVAAENRGIDLTETTIYSELLAYELVRELVSEVVAPDRVSYRESKSYFSVLLDNNNRKPICRFYFHSRSPSVVTFDASGNRHRHHVIGIQSLVTVAPQLREQAARKAD